MWRANHARADSIPAVQASGRVRSLSRPPDPTGPSTESAGSFSHQGWIQRGLGLSLNRGSMRGRVAVCLDILPITR